MESGAYWDSEQGSMKTYDEARTKGETFKKRLGAESVAQLHGLSADTVNNAALWNESTDPGFTAFAPSVDRYVVPRSPGQVFDRAETQKIPLLAGFIGNEQFPFLSQSLPHRSTTEYREV